MAVLVMAGGLATAGSSQADLTVTASVADNCIISTTSLSFSSYDPIVTNKTNPLDVGTGKVTITCTQGAVATIGLDAGLNGADAAGTTRAMKSGSNFLSYEIYQDSGRTTVWGNTEGTVLSPEAAPSSAPRDYFTFGRVPAGQDVPKGANYTDTVVATVNF